MESQTSRNTTDFMLGQIGVQTGSNCNAMGLQWHEDTKHKPQTINNSESRAPSRTMSGFEKLLFNMTGIAGVAYFVQDGTIPFDALFSENADFIMWCAAFSTYLVSGFVGVLALRILVPLLKVAAGLALIVGVLWLLNIPS